jgi:membrane protein DedA with SNARE-associated domain/rhodanese-related sulfurtransferase
MEAQRETIVSAGPLVIGHTIAFVERHGYALLFWWVLAEQCAIPAPSVPLLLAAGALIRTGRLHGLPAIVCCVTAALIADTIWFVLGKHRGRRVLRLLCRVSLEPDSCVRQTENAFIKYGMKSLLIAKFIPGLSAVAAPLAGNSKAAYWRFLLYDGGGAFLWSAAYLATGYLFSEQLETLFAYASRMGSWLVLLVVSLFVVWIVLKYIQRRRFLRQLDIARITPEELRDRLNAGQDLFIVDLSNQASDSEMLPGALRISPEELLTRSEEIPRDREVVLYCTCPNEASSARAALLLRSHGITRVRPLLGGAEAWSKLVMAESGRQESPS